MSQFISDFQREIQNVRESEQQREKAEKQRELADLERQHKAESDFQSFVEKMHQVVQATENAEKERVQMDSFRHQKELERDEKIASMESELIRIRDEHDSMMRQAHMRVLPHTRSVYIVYRIKKNEKNEIKMRTCDIF